MLGIRCSQPLSWSLVFLVLANKAIHYIKDAHIASQQHWHLDRQDTKENTREVFLVSWKRLYQLSRNAASLTRCRWKSLAYTHISVHASGSRGLSAMWEDTGLDSLYLFLLYLRLLHSLINSVSKGSLHYAMIDGKQWSLVELDETGLNPSFVAHNAIPGPLLSPWACFFQYQMKSSIPLSGTPVGIR